MIVPSFENDWSDILASELEQPYFQELLRSLAEQYEQEAIYPSPSAIFNAFRYTSYSEVKAVILGQDPYHGPGQAHGLSFSVLPGVKKPPSLLNMFKELHDDLGCSIPDHGCLEPWARQGVLLLNTVLTVRDGQPASHQGIGWERFTNHVIAELNKRETPVVFVLWGKHAQAKEALIDTGRHTVIASPHPSPLSARRGFFGSRPYSKINASLRQIGVGEISWRIPPLAELEAAAAANGEE
ncbi:uracil-DNA glycosylase [Paenibacillus rhizovicinus]|uniref:Uracil-DNA glycosylase n=1 Tax=Paenibacillus rhizovicinus TaxID=2704463 RepID=A0A6C0P979_9BACL|nr:uracil-DNA glycosylase [Paenibacillus rhizovicinus]QHW34935.1 uracil-DNA glycosylase [Paenibacillus rhizovicinus]